MSLTGHDRPRVGVHPVLDPSWGGIYQYSNVVLHALDSMRDVVEPVIVHDRPTGLPIAANESGKWATLSFGPLATRHHARRALVRAVGEPATTKAVALARRSVKLRPSTSSAVDSLPHPRAGTAEWLRSRGIGLMVYPGPTTLSFETAIPYVMAVHDLQHRLQPEFPEVSQHGELESREYLYANGIRDACGILVDSEVGREDVLQHYGQLIDPGRVHVLPFVPPPALRRPKKARSAALRAELGVVDPYLLFPAQFWPHKNHLRVVEAVAALRASGRIVSLVLTGSAGGELRSHQHGQVIALAERLGIADQLQILGYVDDELLAALYADSKGVLLPTFFGPTNIPVIEGWAFRVPVLTSDIRGIREQVGDAALLVDPRSVASIADGIWQLWADEPRRQRLVEAGDRRVQGLDVQSFAARLRAVLLAQLESTVPTASPLGGRP